VPLARRLSQNARPERRDSCPRGAGGGEGVRVPGNAAPGSSICGVRIGSGAGKSLLQLRASDPSSGYWVRAVAGADVALRPSASGRPPVSGCLAGSLRRARQCRRFRSHQCVHHRNGSLARVAGAWPTYPRGRTCDRNRVDGGRRRCSRSHVRL